MWRYSTTSDHATLHKQNQETAEMSEMLPYSTTSDHATSHKQNQETAEIC